VLGSLADATAATESADSDVVAAQPPLPAACVLGGVAALIFALWITS
jgi:hypothetical protein